MLRELLRGFIRVQILFGASEEPVYGVALMAELARHGYRVGPGTLYPILYRLEHQGVLRKEGQVVNGKVRKYYRITSPGRRVLRRAQAQLQELAVEVLPTQRPATRGQHGRGGRKPR
jgi:DNA-binding PadR family transcriptional regulator